MHSPTQPGLRTKGKISSRLRSPDNVALWLLCGTRPCFLQANSSSCGCRLGDVNVQLKRCVFEDCDAVYCEDCWMYLPLSARLTCIREDWCYECCRRDISTDDFKKPSKSLILFKPPDFSEWDRILDVFPRYLHDEILIDPKIPSRRNNREKIVFKR
jgi:hypothetical protein